LLYHGAEGVFDLVSLKVAVYILLAYAIGSVPFAYLFTRWYGGKDIRDVAWGNVGTANVMVNIGKIPGILTMIGDVLKGYIAAVLGAVSPLPVLRFVMPIVAITGHNWPVWLKFKGGGGLATFIGGALFLLKWYHILFMMAVWGVLHLFIKHPDKSAAAACITVPVLCLVSGWDVGSMLYVGGSSITILVKRVQCLAAEYRSKKLRDF
jgi:glycerol-3-phosphate acyltransferase PlsY